MSMTGSPGKGLCPYWGGESLLLYSVMHAVPKLFLGPLVGVAETWQITQPLFPNVKSH